MNDKRRPGFSPMRLLWDGTGADARGKLYHEFPSQSALSGREAAAE